MRPTSEQNFIEIAQVVARRGTCTRRQVGAVLVDHLNHILSTGYNGPATGMDHCIDHPCPGASMASGTGLSICEAIHAEANALLQCPNINAINTCYCTVSPCMDCTKLLMNTSCMNIIYDVPYPGMNMCKELWLRKPGRNWLYAGDA